MIGLRVAFHLPDNCVMTLLAVYRLVICGQISTAAVCLSVCHIRNL